MKILLAEDEASVAAMMHKGLSEKGYEVSVAQDGHTALAMALEYNFRLIILDIMMPGINGLEICRQLRKNKINLPVLMLTALGTIDACVNAYRTWHY